MKIISFTEGARQDRGGFGLIGLPFIINSIARQGQTAILNISGTPIPSLELVLNPNSSIYDNRLSVNLFRAENQWFFSIRLIFHNVKSVKQADFIMLNSLYSFPVLAGYFLACLYRKPYSIHFHGVLAPNQRNVSSRKKRILDLIIARRIINKAAVIIYTAKGEREETIPLKLKAPSVVVPLGFDMSEFEHLPNRGLFRAEYLNGYSGPLVLFLSRINAKKGLDVLAETMALVAKQIPDVRLAIVGSGDPPDFTDKVKGWLKKNRITHITIMPGLLQGQKKLEAFADADVFVLPSHAENFGFAMFEAMACRVPVVVTDTLNLAGEVRAAEAGRIVPRKAQFFADAIIELLKNKELREKMGENGYWLAQSYTWDSTGEKIVRTIKSILENRPLPDDLLPESGNARQ